MRTQISRCIWLVLFLSPALVGFLHGQQGRESSPDPIQALVRHLGSNAYAVRNDASKKLVALGEKAIPALRQAAARSEDPEVRRRASELILAILPTNRKSDAVGLVLVRIEAGRFAMGSPPSERNRRPDESLHDVRIREPFYMGIHEITQEQFQKVMGVTPSWFADSGPGKESVRGIDPSRLPVERVTWFDALEFCNRLSKRDGFPEFYKLAAAKREENAIVGARVEIRGGNGYRLPTEAEWEYACRANSASPYHFARTPTGRDGNFRSSLVAGGYGSLPAWQALNRTTTVGAYPANDFGLFDMHGNVGEWCWDLYDKDYYTNSPGADPVGPGTGIHRVVRGGSWLVTEGSCRSASRFMLIPSQRDYSVGFRVARNP